MYREKLPPLNKLLNEEDKFSDDDDWMEVASKFGTPTNEAAPKSSIDPLLGPSVSSHGK